MEEKAKIRISLKDGVFEITGSQEFVSTQIENFEEVITETIENYPQENLQSINTNNDHQQDKSANSFSDDEVTKYRSLYDYDGDTIKILKRIPGGSAKERMINTALLYLFGKSLKFDGEKAPFSDIRQISEDHGFLDTNNFSSALNGANELLNCSGSGKSQEAKLTFPGKEKAKSLANEIIADESE